MILKGKKFQEARVNEAFPRSFREFDENSNPACSKTKGLAEYPISKFTLKLKIFPLQQLNFKVAIPKSIS